MRSIIINTLGAAHSRKDVYFMAFAPDQVTWLDAELDQLHETVQLIRQLRRQQTEYEDYHLFILMDADRFEGAAHEDHVQRIQKVLRAWLVTQLLKPLDELAIAPLSATELILNCNRADNTTSPVRGYLEMLHLDPEALPETVALPYQAPDGTERSLDLTQVLSLADHVQPQPDPEAAEPVAQPARPKSSRLDDFADDPLPTVQKKQDWRQEAIQDSLEKTINELQAFRLIRNQKQVMPIQTILCQSSLPDRRAVNADLQINLARLIRHADGTGLPDSAAVRWHDSKELAQLLADAEATLAAQIDPDSPQPIYFELEDNLYSASDAADMTKAMYQRLRTEVGNVPGVTDALTELEESGSAEEALPEPSGDSLTAQVRRQLRSEFVLVGRERKRFQERYAQLMAEYRRETVLDDQRKIFDICAGSYTAWRTDERRAAPRRKAEPTQVRRPILEAEKYKELIAARDRCAEGVLAQLEDFTDVREEAAKLHTEFSSLSRLWTPNLHTLNGRYFYRFSLIMGLIFVVLMILPFFLISGQLGDLKLSRAAAYLINSGVFLLLYGVGFVIWLRKLARDIRALRVKLEVLILKSAEARRESVLRAIATYTQELPGCLIQQLNYSAMTEIDADNGRASQKYEQHMRYLKDAVKEISDVRTALRAQGYHVSGEAARKRLDLLRAPYDPVNQDLYMLFAERSVGAGDPH